MRYDDDERRYYKLRNELPSKLVFYSPLSLISLTLHIDHLKQLGNLLQPISFSHDSRPLAVSDYDWSKKIP